MPDPSAGAGGGVGLTAPTDAAAFQKALDACQSVAANGQSSTASDPAQQKKALAQAKCLRAHGVDVPDPQPGHSTRLPTGSNVDAALKACGIDGAGQ
jgi:hypothetical protein